MDLSPVVTWQDLLVHPIRLRELEKAVADKEEVFAVLDHMVKLSVCDRDEAHILQLLCIIARNAGWVGGELHVVIRQPVEKRLVCTIMLLRGPGPIKDLLKKISIPGRFPVFMEFVAAKRIAPFITSRESNDKEIVLVAPRAMSMIPASLQDAVRPGFMKKRMAPLIIPSDIVPEAPPRSLASDVAPPPPSVVGRIATRKQKDATNQPRPATERPPPSDPSAENRYSSVTPRIRESRTTPEPSTAPVVIDGKDVDDDWE